MRLVRIAAVAVCALLAAAPATAQRRPAGDGAPQITKVSPASLRTAKEAADLVIEGRDFARSAEVRVRVRGDRGTGVDYAATVESPTLLRFRLPADYLAKPATLELRVKNPNGTTSDWAALEVRAGGPEGGGGPVVGGPVIDRISPIRVEARSRNVYVTVVGQGLAEGAEVELRAGGTTATARGRMASGNLVFRLPDEVLARPQSVSVRVRGANGVWSDQARLEVVEPGAEPGGGQGGPFVAQVDPRRIDMRGARSQTIEIVGRGIDREAARVLLRPEGSSENGAAVPIVMRSEASNGVVLGVELTPNMVPRTGTYELRVVNPDGRQSNWARLEVVNAAAPGAGGVRAAVDVAIPRTVTLTPVTTTVPVELRVRNEGGSAVRLDEFALVTADGARLSAPGSLEVPGNAERTLRVEAPVPLAAGAGGRGAERYQVAFAYAIAPASGGSKAERRHPESGFETISVRNEIPLVDLGREFVRDPQVGNTEGWRFFKSANPANEGAGRLAEFYLFAEPFSGERRRSVALVNYRPDPNDPRERGVFYLVLRPDEVSRLDERGRARGTTLGYVSAEEAPGLVPLYRWSLGDASRATNHFLSTSRERSGLPPRLQQQQGWRLEGVVGYVIPRQ